MTLRVVACSDVARIEYLELSVAGAVPGPQGDTALPHALLCEVSAMRVRTSGERGRHAGVRVGC